MKVLVTDILKHFRVIGVLFRATILTSLEYKMDLLITVFGEIVWTLVNLVFLEIIFMQTSDIAGWSREEVFFLYGLGRVLRKLATSFVFINIKEMATEINQGRLDILLTKPVNSRIFLMFKKFDVSELIGNLASVVIMVYAAAQITLDLSVLNLLIVFVIFCIMVVTFVSMFFAFFSLAFWLGDIGHGYWIFAEGFKIGILPPGVFQGVWQVVFGLVIPVVLFGALPAAVLLNRFDVNSLLVILPFTVFWFFFGQLRMDKRTQVLHQRRRVVGLLFILANLT